MKHLKISYNKTVRVAASITVPDEVDPLNVSEAYLIGLAEGNPAAKVETWNPSTDCAMTGAAQLIDGEWTVLA